MVSPFVTPDWNAPVDVAAALARAPANGTVKGMFLDDVAKIAHQVGGVRPGRAKYVAFKSYPITEWMELLVESAQLAYPHESLRLGLRQLGERAYPVFAESMVGKVLFGVIRGNVKRALSLSPKAISMTTNVGRCDVVELEDQRGVIQLREMYDFADSYNVGVFLGGMHALGTTGEAKLRSLSPLDVDIELTWR